MDEDHKQREDESLEYYLNRISDTFKYLELNYKKKYIEDSTKVSNKKK